MPNNRYIKAYNTSGSNDYLSDAYKKRIYDIFNTNYGLNSGYPSFETFGFKKKKRAIYGLDSYSLFNGKENVLSPFAQTLNASTSKPSASAFKTNSFTAKDLFSTNPTVSMPAANYLATKAKSNPDFKSKQTVGKIKMDKGLQIGSFAANMLSSGLQANNKYESKFGKETGLSSSVESGLNLLGPWGMAASAAMKLGPSLANAIGKTNKYGVYTKNKGAAFALNMLNPIAVASNTLKADYLTNDQKIEGLLNPYSAFKKAQEFGKAQEVADKEYKRKQNVYLNTMRKLNDRKDAYGNYLSNLAASGMMAAKTGLQLSLNRIKAAQKGMMIEVKHIDPVNRSVTEKKTIIMTSDDNGNKKGSIIPDGVNHGEENNNCDIEVKGEKGKSCDTGLSVVSADGTKILEIEKDELVLRREASIAIDELIKKYKEEKDESILGMIGKFMKEELLDDTYSYSPSYKCLNDNSCKISKN